MTKGWRLAANRQRRRFAIGLPAFVIPGRSRPKAVAKTLVSMPEQWPCEPAVGKRGTPVKCAKMRAGPCPMMLWPAGLDRLCSAIAPQPSGMTARLDACRSSSALPPAIKKSRFLDFSNIRLMATAAFQAWQASNVRFNRSASSSRPMKTSRLSCFSPSFQARWWSPSMIMCTPWTT
jgi:hypothetical protein